MDDDAKVGLVDTHVRTGNCQSDSLLSAGQNVSDNLMSVNNNALDSIVNSGNSKITVGVPVYFFFQLNSDRLVDESQIVNLDDIAEISKAHNLKVTISEQQTVPLVHSPSIGSLVASCQICSSKSLLIEGYHEGLIHLHSFGGIDKFKVPMTLTVLRWSCLLNDNR